jgi:hypothetical protein
MSEQTSRFKWKKPEWWGEFVTQSLAIIGSILLALWVDQWKSAREDRDLANEALVNFLKEIRQNSARLDDALPYHKGVLEASRTGRTQAELQSAQGADALRGPSLLQTAWLTAVSTGVLTKIDYSTVAALSHTYTLQERFREDNRDGVQSVVAAGIGSTAAATRLADQVMRTMVSNEEELRATYTEAERVVRAKLESEGVTLPPDGAAPAATGGSASTRKPPPT